MSGPRIVALDVGSSSVRAVAYDEHGTAEPGEAQLAYAHSDADELVAACRAVLAQVGEGDEVAISCFWHSLVAVDEHDRPLTPVLTWRDLGGSPPALDPEDYHRRTGCFEHPAYWPAKIGRLRAEGVRAARYLSFGDYLLLRLAGEARSSISTASGTGPLRPEPARLGRGDACSGRHRPRAAAAGLRRTGRRRSPCARRRRVLERRRGVHHARSSRADGRDLGCPARRVRRRRGRSAPGPLPLPARRPPFLRGRCALRWRQPPCLAPGDAAGRCRRRPRGAPRGRSRSHLPALSWRRALSRLECEPARGDPRALVLDERGGHRPGRARRRLLPAGGRAGRARRRRVDRGHGRRAAREPRLGADPGRRARLSARGVGCRRGLGARCCDDGARAGRPAGPARADREGRGAAAGPARNPSRPRGQNSER